MQTLGIQKLRIPYSFDLELSGQLYNFSCNYNSKENFFTVDLALDGETIAAGEKIILGQPLFAAHVDSRLPSEVLLPLAPADDAQRVGFRELGESVFVFILGGDV